MRTKVKVTYKQGDSTLWPCEAWAYRGFLSSGSTVGLGKTWELAKQALLQRLREKAAIKEWHKQPKGPTPPPEVIDLVST